MKHLWYVSNFSTPKLNRSNLYALTVISQTWQLLKEHLSSRASFHVSAANYCTLSTPRHFRDDEKIRDSSLVSGPPIQLADGLSWQRMISSLRNDSLWPCGEVHHLHLQCIITGSFVSDWPMLLFTVDLKHVASFSCAHPPATSTQPLSKQQQSGNFTVDSLKYFLNCPTSTTSFRSATAGQTAFADVHIRSDAQLLVWLKMTGFREWRKLLYHSDVVRLLLRVYAHFI